MRLGIVATALVVGPVAIAISVYGCGVFSSGDCTDKALCTDDGGTFDGSIDVLIGDTHAPMDVSTIVKPDGDVPDGDCNSGIEDCANGVDDNCDGLIDCADPLCQSAGYACTGAPPTGWSGPVAFADVTSGSVPACAGAFTTDSVDGNGSLDAPAATCSCTCGGAQGETCGSTTTTIYDDDCTTACDTVHFAAGQCINFTCGAVAQYTPNFATTGGTCKVNATSAITPYSWGHTFRACDYAGAHDTGGCMAQNVCVASTGSGFAAKPCVYQSGDVACPGAPYTTKTTVYTSVSDTRMCSTCNCAGPTGGMCNALVNYFYASGCNTGYVFTGNLSGTTCGGCEPEGQPAMSGQAESTFNLTPGTCATTPTSGGQATGSASGAGPTTVCCQ